MRRALFASLLLCMPVLAGTPAAHADENGISVTNVWSRQAMAGRTGVVYLTIMDNGAPDRLTGAGSPVAATVTLHESINDNGVMKMRPVAAVPVQPGKPVKLSPGGYHIMLEGLKQALQPGQTFPVTLTFAKAGSISTTATVQKGAGGMAMDRGSMSGMDMSGGSHSASMSGMNMGGGTAQH